MADYNDLTSSDYFFYYDTLPLRDVTQHEIYVDLLQPSRSFYYDRKEGSGIVNDEQFNNTILLQTLGRFKIADSIAYKNTLVTNGSDGYPDRRIAISQTSIYFFAQDDNLEIGVLAFLYTDSVPLQLNIPVGVN